MTLRPRSRRLCLNESGFQLQDSRVQTPNLFCKSLCLSQKNPARRPGSTDGGVRSETNSIYLLPFVAASVPDTAIKDFGKEDRQGLIGRTFWANARTSPPMKFEQDVQPFDGGNTT